jgi:murein DD-endopeptidase MepM/ murein hydrolase activator NlpD
MIMRTGNDDVSATKRVNAKMAGNIQRILYVIVLAWVSGGMFGCGPSVRENRSKPLKGYWYTVKAGDSQRSLKQSHGLDLNDLREINGLANDEALKPGQRLFLFGVHKGKKRVAKTRVPTKKRPKSKVRKQLPKSDRKWIWPVRGARLTSKFGKRGNRPHKGIDLAKKPGAPIYAAADGVVVYSGSRQRGYGNLVILKHSGGYVTVYAHNRRNLVDEGERVRQGFQIAELGNTGRSTGPHLHFEIRHKGKPINPLRLLGKAPKR